MAVGDKIQLAFKSEVTTVNNSVNTLSTTVNDPTTGLVARVTNLEAGGGAGMTPQQVEDLQACVTDKHTHANKTVLDLITAEFTTAEKTKLGNLTDNFKGLYADAIARNLGVASPASGNYVLQEDTNTVWYFNGASWLNTGVSNTGDMTKAVYDPTSKNADAFSMDSMVETTTKKILTSDERSRLDKYRGSVASSLAMDALSTPSRGHFCIRHDTDTVWIYNGTIWLNSASGGPSVGDTKFSYRTADHDGWYILNGRSVSTLSANAQAAAATMGWSTIVPNTQGRYALAASPTITSGTTGGTSFIAQNSLPNIALSGTTSNNNVGHTHSIPSLSVSGSTSNVAATNSTDKFVLSASSSWTMDSEVGGDITGTTRKYPAYASQSATSSFVDSSHSHTISGSTGANTTFSNSANHTHTFTTSSINGNVVQVAHLPTYSAKTEFVFLGL